MSTIVIKDLTIDQTLEKQSMRHLSGGGCLQGHHCGPADEPLPETHGPLGVLDIFNGNSAVEFLEKWRLPEIAQEPMIPY